MPISDPRSETQALLRALIARVQSLIITARCPPADPRKKMARGPPLAAEFRDFLLANHENYENSAGNAGKFAGKGAKNDADARIFDANERNIDNNERIIGNNERGFEGFGAPRVPGVCLPGGREGSQR
jgi:hypothetical protein